MGDCIDQEVAMSQWDKEIETEAAWQAHYIKWAHVMNTADPCGHQQGYQCIVAIYIKYLMSGVNFRNKDFLRSDMVRGYATSINVLFKLQDMKPPVNVANPNNILTSSSTTLSKRRISQGSTVCWTVISSLNCFASLTCLGPGTPSIAPYSISSQ